MATEPDDDKFLDVLAGRRAADDADTRRAARLRQYFEMHPTAEERPQADPEGEARLLAYLRARQGQQPGIGSTKSTGAGPADAPGPLQRLLRWLLPPGASLMPRLGMAAAAMLGVAVVLRITLPSADDDGTMKGGAPAVETVRYAVDPAAEAAAIQSVLAGAGVPLTLEVQGSERLLRADVPPEKLRPVAEALAARGLTLPPDGRLVVRVKPQ